VDDAKCFLTFPGEAALPRSLDDRRRKMGDILKSMREPLICIIVNMGISDVCIDWGENARSTRQSKNARSVCACVFVVGWEGGAVGSQQRFAKRKATIDRLFTW
jgi:hypothetical protein